AIGAVTAADLGDLVSHVLEDHLQGVLASRYFRRIRQPSGDQPGDDDHHHHHHPGEDDRGVELEAAPLPVDDFVARELADVLRYAPLDSMHRHNDQNITDLTDTKPTSPASIRVVRPWTITMTIAPIRAGRNKKKAIAMSSGRRTATSRSNVHRTPPKKTKPAN